MEVSTDAKENTIPADCGNELRRSSREKSLPGRLRDYLVQLPGHREASTE